MEYLEHMKTHYIQRIAGLLGMCLILGLMTPALQAQSLSGTDLTTINVDDLSDQQLLSYMQQAEASGYSQLQLEAFARQRGMSESQISKLRARISKLKLSSAGSGGESGPAQMSRNSLILSEEGIFGKLANSEIGPKSETSVSKVFGFGLFSSNKLNFSPNLNIPTPIDYVLGPGDELVVDLWGATQQYWTFEVSPEGTIRPQDLSPIYVNGLTIEKARKKIVDRLSQVYGGLKPLNNREATIFYQISLGNIRSINVTVIGEVNSPGNYVLSSLSTVFTALHAAGGPTEKGTFRSIRLMRNNKMRSEIDLYDFLVDGLKPNDELLRDGDVIIVKLHNGQVEIDGEIRRPGIYEVKEGETFEEIIRIAGSFTKKAFKSFVSVERNSLNGREILDINAVDFGEKYPEDGDLLFIRQNLEVFANRVQIEGAVQMEGTYELTENMTLKTLIEKANGPRGDAYFKRATIYRMNSDFSQETIAFDLQKLLSGEIGDIPLKNEDIITISSIYDLREEYYVEISGEVAFSGVYPYINHMTVADIIVLAGGLTEGASGARVEVSRRNTEGIINSLSEIILLDLNKDLNVTDPSQSVEIKPFDQIFIRRTPNYNLQQQITLEGEVANPGIYAISRKDERISDIIKRANGLTGYAYPEGAILVRKTEFEEKKSDYEINLEKLDLLKEKILSDTLMTVNQARDELIERLENMITKMEEDIMEENYVRTQFMKRFSENLSDYTIDGDSLDVKAPVMFEGREPTVIDLKEVLSNPGSKYDYIVKEGDVLSIPSKLETVRVSGEVISALNLRYDQSLSFKDYINDAGGFTSVARRATSYVQYPNGRRKKTRRFLFFKFYPKVEPGSTIIVTKKPQRDKISIQEILAITSSLATITFLVDRITN